MSDRKLTKEERIRVAELFADGYTITELSIMYHKSIFRIMGVLERFGVEV